MSFTDTPAPDEPEQQDVPEAPAEAEPEPEAPSTVADHWTVYARGDGSQYLVYTGTGDLGGLELRTEPESPDHVALAPTVTP